MTLTGPGGVGKTRLAIQVAHVVAADFLDGVWFVPLAPIRDPALVASTIARTIGIVETAGRSSEEGLAAFFAERQTLLVLDNFEQVLDAAPFVTELLAGCPAMKVLVTSRAVLRLSVEHHLVVPPLASIDPARPLLGQLGTGPLSDQVGRQPLITGGIVIQALRRWGSTARVGLPHAARGDRRRGASEWRASSVGVYRLWRDGGYAIGALLGLHWAIEPSGYLPSLPAWW